MYVLKNSYYPNDILVLSENKATLEEIELSIYEEDMYDWFCVLNESEAQYVSFSEIVFNAERRAFKDSLDYDIIELDVI